MNKPLQTSMTIQGAVVGSLLGILTILRAFGINVDLDEGMITETVASIAFVVSSAMTIYGRLRIE